MKKSFSIYEELRLSLASISDNDEIVEPYWHNLDDEQQHFFDDISERIDNEKREIAKCRRDCTVYENYTELKNLVDLFHEKFSDFPNIEIFFKKVNFIIYISEKIFSTSSTIPDEEVSDVFSVFIVDLQLASLAFATNLNKLENNILWCNPNIESSLNKLIEFDTDIEVWYGLLANINHIDFSVRNEIILCDKVCVTRELKNNVISLLKLHMVSSGEKITNPITYNLKPSNSSIEEFCPRLKFAQFDDVINILGEYNNRQDILSKYLSAYHVIESFMFKYPIVKLERKNDGNMFSIRDFRRLYNSVEVSESKAIEDLIRESFNININGKKFQNFTFEKWKAFLESNTNTDNKDVDKFLNKLSLQNSAAVAKAGMAKFLGKLIYQVRCSIVHNKATEYHISTQNYPHGCSLLIEKFLLSIIEEFIFLLLSKENELVWYQTDSLKLWECS